MAPDLGIATMSGHLNTHVSAVCAGVAPSRSATASIAGSGTGSADFYGSMKDVPLAVSRETGSLLYM